MYSSIAVIHNYFNTSYHCPLKMTVMLSEVYDIYFHNNIYFHFAEPRGSIKHNLGNTVLARFSYRDIF
jgi:hypothetical protein